MTTETHEGATMIGMHTLESLTADGQLPQLQALALRPPNQWSNWNVATFPLHRTRAPGVGSARLLGQDAATGDNVIAFRPWAIGGKSQSREA